MDNKNLAAVEVVLNSMVKEIITDQEDKGIAASGRSAKSLRVEMDNDGGSVWGSSYFYFQIYGRRPSAKFPPIASFIEWIEEKGIVPEGNMTVESLAFLIARKIRNQGTNIFTGDAPALFMHGIVKEGTGQIVKGIIENAREEIIEIFKILK